MQTSIQPPIPEPMRGGVSPLHAPLHIRAHEGDEPHFHEWSEDAKNAIAEVIWKTENIELTTVGIDIGSSTSHLIFARVHRQRKTPLLSDDSIPIALGIRWHGDPYYARMRELGEGIARVVDVRTGLPLILMVDGDIGKLLGQILEHDLRVSRPVISIDGIQLREFDYVDLGDVIHPSNVVPVIIKSLLFPGH